MMLGEAILRYGRHTTITVLGLGKSDHIYPNQTLQSHSDHLFQKGLRRISMPKTFAFKLPAKRSPAYLAGYTVGIQRQGRH